MVWSDLTFGPLLQGRTRILHLQYFFKYVLSYSLHLNSYFVTFLHNTICRAQLFCPFLLSGSEFLLNMLFNYHLLYFRTALSLILMLSSHYYLHKSKTLSQLTQCPFMGTLLLFKNKMAAMGIFRLSARSWPSRRKGIIGRDRKFAGYAHHYKILTGNIFGLILKHKMAATGVLFSHEN